MTLLCVQAKHELEKLESQLAKLQQQTQHTSVHTLSFRRTESRFNRRSFVLWTSASLSSESRRLLRPRTGYLHLHDDKISCRRRITSKLSFTWLLFIVRYKIMLILSSYDGCLWVSNESINNNIWRSDILVSWYEAANSVLVMVLMTLQSARCTLQCCSSSSSPLHAPAYSPGCRLALAPD